MKKLLYTLSIAIMAIASADAQTNTMQNGPAGAMQIQVGYRKYDTGQLDAALNKAGIAGVADNNIWINLSMNHIHNNWICEDGLGFTPYSSSDVNNIKTHLNQYQAYFRLGYNLSTNKSVTFFPFAGVNFTGAVLSIQDKAREGSTSDFSQELATNTISKTLYQGNFGIDLGAGMDFMIKLKPKKMECFEVQRSIPIGLRAGYYINTSASDWKINDQSLSNSPTNKQSSIFLTLNIGLGYKVNK
jgi:hypothetical protein